ncbi:hypothetical protein AK812_SmicGene42518 [Symbiodinium microadriaticum]|uniref:Peptidase A2 domain-containing protein n=1 Tax=Symbiodinium microadriaticum TaxID=2951 RepID=A0A1Q9C3C0_SYMMI|nr:hypothetical protein AK812_SmicGene42518 [Symbiodinium microadriaticum]
MLYLVFDPMVFRFSVFHVAAPSLMTHHALGERLDDIPLDLFRELQSSHADFLLAREKLLTTKKTGFSRVVVVEAPRFDGFYLNVESLQRVQPHIQHMLTQQLRFLVKVVAETVRDEEGDEREVYSEAESRLTFALQESLYLESSRKRVVGVLTLKLLPGPAALTSNIPAPAGLPPAGGCYTDLPEYLRRGQQGIWTPKNRGHACFELCIRAHLADVGSWSPAERKVAAKARAAPFYDEPAPRGPGAALRDERRMVDVGLDFSMLPRGPVSFQDVDSFEEKNVGMVGIFVYEPLSEEWAASATTTLRPLREPSVEKPYLHEIVLLLCRQHFSLIYDFSKVVLDSGADTHVLPLSYYSEELGTSAYPKLKLVIRDVQGNAIHTTEQKMNITFEFRKENGKKICVMDSAVFGNVTQPLFAVGKLWKCGWGIEPKDSQSAYLKKGKTMVPIRIDWDAKYTYNPRKDDVKAFPYRTTLLTTYEEEEVKWSALEFFECGEEWSGRERMEITASKRWNVVVTIMEREPCGMEAYGKYVNPFTTSIEEEKSTKKKSDEEKDREEVMKDLDALESGEKTPDDDERTTYDEKEEKRKQVEEKLPSIGVKITSECTLYLWEEMVRQMIISLVMVLDLMKQDRTLRQAKIAEVNEMMIMVMMMMMMMMKTLAKVKTHLKHLQSGIWKVKLKNLLTEMKVLKEMPEGFQATEDGNVEITMNPKYIEGICAQWFQIMDDRLWRLLEDSGCICVSELRVHFATPWHLACSVDSLEDATVLAEQVMPKALPAEHKRIGGHVWKWISDNTNLLSRVQARLRSKATRIEASAGSKVSPGEVFDQLMSGSLELCKQTSRAHSRWISGGAGTPIEAEKAAKKFWGTVLVQIMVEARLPIVEIPVENEEQRVMYALRALGARRSKTLRNRARTWRKARDWMQSVKGYVFPRSPADVVDYLIFLEQESGTKSCISEFMSALSVLEDAGLGQQDRTFLVFQSSADFEEPCFKFAKPEVISNYMRLIWRQLKVPFKKLGEPAWKPRTERDLLGTECYLFWSGHSMRHVLPTIAAVFGVPKEQRDYLGRWHVGLHHSSDYIHTCRQIVHDIQRRVCDKLSGGKPGYDEEELFEDFGAWLRERGLDPEPWVKRHAILRTVNGCKVLNQTWPLLREFTDRPDDSVPALPASNTSQDEKESPFWVSISRHSGHRRLHIRNGCWVTPGSCHKFAEVWAVDSSVADSFCKLCYKNKEGSSSSSGESSSTDLGEPAESSDPVMPTFGMGP